MPENKITLDPARSVLLRAQNLKPEDQQAAWEAYHQSADEDDLATKLKDSPLPTHVKHDLWEAKHTEGLVKASQTSQAQAGGDPELAGVYRAKKIVQLANQDPDVAKTLNMATNHPWLAKIIAEKPEQPEKLEAKSEPKPETKKEVVPKEEIAPKETNLEGPSTLSPPTPAPSGLLSTPVDWVTIQDSRGGVHQIPQTALAGLQQKDPGLKIIGGK